MDQQERSAGKGESVATTPLLRSLLFRWPLRRVLLLVTGVAICLAVLRTGTLRDTGLAVFSIAISLALAPLFVWLVQAVWIDGIAAILRGRLNQLSIWFHWQRGIVIGSFMILAILWTAIENELLENAPSAVAALPPAILVVATLTAAWFATRSLNLKES